MNNVGHFKHLVESIERKALNEDWGSSDWYPVIKNIDAAVEKNGLSPEVITQAAQNEADFYYDIMGYENPSEAIDSIISAWTRMSDTGQKLARMFAPLEEPLEEDRQEFGDNRLPYDIEFDNEDITIFTLGGEPVLEMPLDDWMALISKFNRVFRGKEGPR